MAKGDDTVPNPTNYWLYTNMGATTVTYQGAGGASVAHGFLATTPTAQADAATFLDTGVAPATSVVTLP